MKNIYQKLLEFQTSVETIKKDGKNEFFKKSNGSASTYATLPNILENVKPILNALKITLTQPIIANEVITLLTDTESGEEIKSGIHLPAGLNAQQTGSAITYFRRYTLSSLLSLEIDEDDDGNQASVSVDAQKEWLNKWTNKTQSATTETWNKVVAALKSKEFAIKDVEKKYKVSQVLKKELEAL